MLTARLLAAISLVAGLAPAQSILYRFDGDAPGDRLGHSVAAAGDVNRDGTPDLVAGAPFNSARGTNAGMARVFCGATGAVLYTFYGEAAGDHFGWSVDGAGDVNADGFADIIVGAYGDSTNGLESGGVTVFSGSDGAVVWRQHGAAAGQRLGWDVCGAGDFDGDGHDDVLVGVPGFVHPQLAEFGAARVFSGRTAQLLHELPHDLSAYTCPFHCAVSGNLGFRVDATRASTSLGTSILTATSPEFRSVLSGSTISQVSYGVGLRPLAWGSASADYTNASWGYAIALDSKLVGAPTFGGEVNPGSAAAVIVPAAAGVVLFDAVEHSLNPNTPIPYFGVAGDAAGDQLGFALASLGDVDGDGLEDTLAAAPFSDVGAADGGSIRISSGADLSTLRIVHGTRAGDSLGYSVAAPGDLTGDGAPEIAAGAPFSDINGADSGSVYVYQTGLPGPPASATPPVTVYGLACPSSNGHKPRIGYSGLNNVGETFTIWLRGAAPIAGAFLHAGRPLDIALDIIGMPGCTLYGDAPTVYFATDGSGTAAGHLILPLHPFWIGAPMNFQWVIWDPAAPYALPVTTSDAMSSVVGGIVP